MSAARARGTAWGYRHRRLRRRKPQPYLKTVRPLSPEEAQLLRVQFLKAYRSGRPLVLSEGVEVSWL